MSTADARPKDFFGIPLPNEKEADADPALQKRKPFALAGVLDYVRTHIRIEDIILVGLIILMLDESIEDDILLIILIYILLF
jgi:hypothetical protein